MNVSKIKRQGEKTGRFVQISQSVSPAPLSNYLLARGGDVSARAHTCVALGRCVAFGRPNISVWGSSGHWGRGVWGDQGWGHAGARSRTPKAACHRLSIRLRRSRSNTSTEYSLPGRGGHSIVASGGQSLPRYIVHTHVVLSQRNSSQVKSSHLRPLPSNTAGLRSTFDRLPWLPVVSVYV